MPFTMLMKSSGPPSIHAHTCFNRIDIPKVLDYDTLKIAVMNCIADAGSDSFDMV